VHYVGHYTNLYIAINPTGIKPKKKKKISLHRDLRLTMCDICEYFTQTAFEIYWKERFRPVYLNFLWSVTFLFTDDRIAALTSSVCDLPLGS
jgi:hypothetical protein